MVPPAAQTVSTMFRTNETKSYLVRRRVTSISGSAPFGLTATKMFASRSACIRNLFSRVGPFARRWRACLPEQLLTLFSDADRRFRCTVRSGADVPAGYTSFPVLGGYPTETQHQPAPALAIVFYIWRLVSLFTQAGLNLPQTAAFKESDGPFFVPLRCHTTGQRHHLRFLIGLMAARLTGSRLICATHFPVRHKVYTSRTPQRARPSPPHLADRVIGRSTVQRHRYMRPVYVSHQAPPFPAKPVQPNLL
jgi:hypothetical protein